MSFGDFLFINISQTTNELASNSVVGLGGQLDDNCHVG